MQHRHTAILSGAIALTSFLALGAGAAGATSSPGAYRAPATHASKPTTKEMIGSHGVAKTPTVRAMISTVNGKIEAVLVDSKGLPLYYYRADTAKKSFVSGELAGLWPPLLSAKPIAFGINGKLTALKEAAGTQVAYNGHFLYTFIEDLPGEVTGQGVSNFLVATPRLKTIGSATKITPMAPTSTRGGYGY
jgi:predicted lipoprotein with Yx(FWY)xxD motif